uniref:Uncharacterized protein n=1 Tax=Aegilops tauschii subsp. strangulata TaxID=200361 RepID=A0A453TCW0_AEGTS
LLSPRYPPRRHHPRPPVPRRPRPPPRPPLSSFLARDPPRGLQPPPLRHRVHPAEHRRHRHRPLQRREPPPPRQQKRLLKGTLKNRGLLQNKKHVQVWCRQTRHLDEKKKKCKAGKVETHLEFPGREKVKFGEVVEAPPKLSFPKR